MSNKILTNTTDLQEVLELLGTKTSVSPELQDKTVTPTTSVQTVKADSGYDGLDTVTVNAMPTATQATPSISVNSSGLITASSTQSAGYVSAGTKSTTKQLTTQAAKTITPSTSSQTAVASGVYTTGAVTVGAIPSTYVKPTATKVATTYTPTTSNQTIAAGTYCSGAQTIKGDSNLVAGNIKSGVSIFGVSGSYEGDSSGGIDTSDATATAAEIFKNKTAYVDGEKVTGTFTIEEEVTTQTSLISQIDSALAGKAAAGGSINPDDIGTCTVVINPDTTYAILVSCTIIENGVLSPSLYQSATTITLNNVLCNSAITIASVENILFLTDGCAQWSGSDLVAGDDTSGYVGVFRVPPTSGGTAVIDVNAI